MAGPARPSVPAGQLIMRLHPGEPEANGWRVITIEALLEPLMSTSALGSSQVRSRPRVIAVDGRGGAGKTTLVERLSDLVPASAIIHSDDVAWNHACFDWGRLMIDHVLEPLHRGDPVAYRPQAWVDHGRPGSIALPAGLEVVWIEGTGVIRHELAPYLDASVWIQGDLDVQDHRLLARDGDAPEQLAHVARWMEEELPFLLREQPWRRSTMIIAGDPSPDPALAHDPATEIVVAEPIRTTTA